MKFDEHLAAFLYENKSLRLEGLGTFLLDSKAAVPGVQEKEVYYPIEGLSFIYNAKSETDENLIAYLVKRLNKIHPLVSSDVQSYLTNIQQFLNIGKPYTIEGVGTLIKNNYGSYEFTPGNFLPAKEVLNPHRDNEEHNYPVKSKSSGARALLIIIIALAILTALTGVGWGVYNYFTKQPVTEYVPPADSMPTTTAGVATKDTTLSNADTTTVLTSSAAPAGADGRMRYKMVFETTPSRTRAVARTNQLKTYGGRVAFDSVSTASGVRYNLFIPVEILITDTLRVKDSIGKFLGKSISVVRE